MFVLPDPFEGFIPERFTGFFLLLSDEGLRNRDEITCQGLCPNTPDTINNAPRRVSRRQPGYKIKIRTLKSENETCGQGFFIPACLLSGVTPLAAQRSQDTNSGFLVKRLVIIATFGREDTGRAARLAGALLNEKECICGNLIEKTVCLL